MNPIVDATFTLEKSAGKGGWTFLTMPVMDNLPKKKNSTVRVRGFIDSYELKDFHIWAMKKGTFMAVKADIRKVILKEAGDTVKVTLWLDEAGPVQEDALLECLKEEPTLLARFQKFTKKKQKEFTDHINSATTDEEKVKRIGKCLERLEALG